jgi:hypothetical protein
MITDELLNKYIDNELSEVELKELTEILKNDTDAQLRLKALHLTEEILRKIEISPAPENFTDKFMSKIVISHSVVKDKVSYFYVGMISFFALAIAGILGFSISRIEFGSSNLSGDNQYIEKTNDLFSGGLGYINSFLGNDSVLLTGAVLTFVLLMSGYFILENHKNFKENLSRFCH